MESEMSEATLTADDEAFLRAVAAAPADQLPRLVYADWLDERQRNNEAAEMRSGDLYVATFKEIIGRVMVDAKRSGSAGDDSLEFLDAEGSRYTFAHDQDCCESVYIEDVCGELADLVGSPILVAESVSTVAPSNESGTWTFYKFATAKGHVTVRWGGYSNGYYSESVSFKVQKARVG